MRFLLEPHNNYKLSNVAVVLERRNNCAFQNQSFFLPVMRNFFATRGSFGITSNIINMFNFSRVDKFNYKYPSFPLHQLICMCLKLTI